MLDFTSRLSFADLLLPGTVSLMHCYAGRDSPSKQEREELRVRKTWPSPKLVADKPHDPDALVLGL